jgi:hypothetical protein
VLADLVTTFCSPEALRELGDERGLGRKVVPVAGEVRREDGGGVNLCSTCGEDFGSARAFDTHRVGAFRRRGPAEYTGPLEQWTHRRGRRCLTVAEMEAKNLVRNSRGAWSLQDSLLEARGLGSVQIGSSQRAA